MASTNLPLHVVIIGAGLAGLSTAVFLAEKGHSVTVLEGRSLLAEIGAGIQVQLNAIKLLQAYGLKQRLADKADLSLNSKVRRYSNGEILTEVQKKESDHLLVSRQDFQEILYSAATAAGASVVFDTQITSVDIPTLYEKYGADVVIAADGIRSHVRSWLFGDEEPQLLLANNAYRVLIPRERMMESPDTAELMTQRSGQLWVGPGRYITAYPIAGGKYYNMVLIHPGEALPGTWSHEGDVEDMQKTFSDFEPLAQKLIGLVSSCKDWALARLSKLPTWTSQDGRLLLIGDAAHATTPDLAQGACMCIEDAAVIAECLSAIRHKEDVSLATAAFQELRLERTVRIQQASWDMQSTWILPDGPEQEDRDRRWKATSGTKPTSNTGKPLGWYSEPKFRAWLLEHNAIAEARHYLAEQEWAVLDGETVNGDNH